MFTQLHYDAVMVRLTEFLNKKKLFPVVLAMQSAGPSEKRQLGDVYFKRVLEKDDLDKVLNTIESLGVKQMSLDRIKYLLNSAEQCLESVGLSKGEVQNTIIYPVKKCITYTYPFGPPCRRFFCCQIVHS